MTLVSVSVDVCKEPMLCYQYNESFLSGMQLALYHCAFILSFTENKINVHLAAPQKL